MGNVLDAASPQNSFNPAIPGAIGATTPAAGSFTTVSASTSITPGTGGAILGIRVTRATVDQSIATNTTLASATNMSFAIAASEEWIVDFYLNLGAALNTTGFKLAVTVPASAEMSAACGITPNAPAVAVIFEDTQTGGGALDFTATPADMNGVTIGLVHCSVWVLNSTNAGTVQLQIAQSTSSGTALVLKKGSHMIAHRVA